MKQHQRSIGKNDEWLTPPDILEALGDFDLDPCSPKNPPWLVARDNFSCPERDGLSLNWLGRVWCNPPFNRSARPKWMAKMAGHGNGIMLIPAATETKAFFDYVWTRADAVCFLRGRPHFHRIDGTRAKANCGCSIALVAYGEANAQCLELAGLGFTVRITPPAQSHPQEHEIVTNQTLNGERA